MFEIQSHNQNSDQKVGQDSLSIRLKGKLFYFNKPKIMAILNVNNDSFYAESRANSETEILFKIEKFVSEGADFVDIGAQSTRPGATFIESKEEWNRLAHILPLIRKEFPNVYLSLDTFHSEVANNGINEGMDVINDVSGGDFDSNMFGVIAQHQVPYLVMHTSDKPQIMQSQTNYADVTQVVLYNLSQKVLKLNTIGVNDIMIDPGFGFGKTLNQNYELLQNLAVFKQLNCPILAGLSRKSMVNKVLNIQADQALNGSTVLHTLALMNGANLLRVHDAKEAKEAVELVSYYQNI